MANALSGGLTNFPNGLSSFGLPVIPGLPVPFNGNVFWVKEPSGTASGTQPADSGSGTITSPYSNLNLALSACTSGNNDVILFSGTLHVTESVVWDKNQTHLIGICSPLMRGKRARISSTGSTVFTPMVSVTANGCLFQNIGTFYGYGNASAQVLWSDTGGRNCYQNCEFLSFGNATMAAQTGGRALVLSGDTGECTFNNCVFGVDTVARTAANYTLEIAGGSPRNYFSNCHFEAYLTGSGSNACHLLIGSGGIDRYLKFTNCQFHAETKSGGSSAMTQVMNISGSAGGFVVADDCWFTGVTDVETSASGNLFMTNCVVDTADAGLTVVSAPS